MTRDKLAVSVVLRFQVIYSGSTSYGHYESLKLKNHTASRNEDLPAAAELLRGKWGVGV